MNLIQIFILLLFTATATPIVIDDHCLVFSQKEIPVHGSHMTVTYWNPGVLEKGKFPLQLFVYFTGKTVPDDYSIVYVFSSKIVHQKFRYGDSTRTESPLEPSIPPGWVDLHLLFGAHFKVMRNSSSESIMDVEGSLQVEKIKILGSSVTVDCQKNKVWMITNQRQTIPLDGTQNLTIYSKTEIKPVITLEQEDYRIGWEGNRYTVGSNVPPLPPFLEHNVRLKCNDAPSKNRSCSMLFGEDTEIGPFSCGERNRSITMSSQDEIFYLQLHRASSMKENETKNGQTIPVIIGFLLCGAIIIGLLIATFKLKFRKQNKNIARHSDIEIQAINTPLLQENATTLDPHSTLGSIETLKENVKMESQPQLFKKNSGMWSAVNADNVELIQHLLKKGINPDAVEETRMTTALLEAHVLGKSEIVKAFLAHMGEEFTPPSNELVKQVMQILTTRINEVFTAAKCGMYSREDGVHVKLQSGQLPSTIKDEGGWSVIHHIANAKFEEDGRPHWEAHDIRSFFQTEKPFPNAINYWGQTALHILASRQRQKDDISTVWDGRNCTVKEAWLGVARLLIEYGCDPRIKDHRGELATAIARGNGYPELAEILLKEYNDRDEVDWDATRRKFPDLVTASKEGDTSRISDLLMEHVPTLAIYAEANPLDEALRHSHRDAVFLLLSAGAPLCDQVFDTLTPLEVSHHMVGQPALFPALIRKSYIDRLTAEDARVRNDPSLTLSLREFRDDVAERGDQARWNFKGDLVDCTNEAKRMMLLATENGLSLTCKMLSQRQFCLHAVPGEKKPIDLAIERRHHNTAYGLCRDLWMRPYTGQTYEQTPKELLYDLKQRDLLILQKICQYRSETYGKETCDAIYESLSSGELPKDEHLDLALYWIAENGLVALLHELFQKDVKLDRKIVKFSGSTILHIAALYGHTNMVEYIRYNRESSDKDIWGFEVTDYAAMARDNICLTYMCMGKGDSGSWLQLYEAWRKRYEEANVEPGFLEYSRQDAMSALSEPYRHGHVYEVLKRKGEKLNIKCFADLENIAVEALDENVMATLFKIFREKIDVLSKIIAKEDSRFSGNMTIPGPLPGGYEVTSFDTINVIFELNLDAISDNSDIKIEEDGNHILHVTSKENAEFFRPENFKKAFVSLMENVLRHPDLQSDQKLSPVPPYLVPCNRGVFLYWMWKDDGSGTVRYFRMHIRPAVKVRAPKNFERNLFQSREHFDANEAFILVQLASFERRYLYTSYTPTGKLMQNLSKEERKVVYMCRFLMKLSISRWSYERRRTDPMTPAWQDPSDKTERGAKSLELIFLEELNETKSSDFRTDNVCERVMSVLRRATEVDAKGNLVSKKEIPLIYDPLLKVTNTWESVTGIIKYLQTLTKDPNISFY